MLTSTRPFYAACRDGHTEIVKHMMQHERIDVNKQDSFGGCTPFYLACQNGHTEIVKYMMQDERVDVNKQDKDGWTPIWIASDKNHTQVVQAILQSGRYINLDAKYENKTALEQAREKGFQEIANLLTEYISTHPDHFKDFLKSQFQAGKLEIIQQN